MPDVDELDHRSGLELTVDALDSRQEQRAPGAQASLGVPVDPDGAHWVRDPAYPAGARCEPLAGGPYDRPHPGPRAEAPGDYVRVARRPDHALDAAVGGACGRVELGTHAAAALLRRHGPDRSGPFWRQASDPVPHLAVGVYPADVGKEGQPRRLGRHGDGNRDLIVVEL